MIHYQTVDATVVDFAPFLVDRIDTVVSQNPAVEDVDALFSLVLSDGSAKYDPSVVSVRPAPRVAATSPPQPQTQPQSQPAGENELRAAPASSSSSNSVMSDDEEGFFMLDDSPHPNQKRSASSPSSSSQAQVPGNAKQPSKATSAVPHPSAAKGSDPARAGSRDKLPGGAERGADDDESDSDDADMWVMLEATEDPTMYAQAAMFVRTPRPSHPSPVFLVM